MSSLSLAPCGLRTGECPLDGARENHRPNRGQLCCGNREEQGPAGSTPSPEERHSTGEAWRANGTRPDAAPGMAGWVPMYPITLCLSYRLQYVPHLMCIASSMVPHWSHQWSLYTPRGMFWPCLESIIWIRLLSYMPSWMLPFLYELWHLWFLFLFTVHVRIISPREIKQEQTISL